jgi:hypothetical protein
MSSVNLSRFDAVTPRKADYLSSVIPRETRNLQLYKIRRFAANERMPLAHEFSLSRWSGLTSRRSQRVEVNALHPRYRAKQFIGLFQASRSSGLLRVSG